MPMFMKAGSIKGSVAAESHKNWIPVQSCTFSVGFEEDDVRKSRAEGAPEPKLEPLEVTKETDESAPGLMKWMLDGDTLDEVTIDVCGDTLFDGSWRTHLRYVVKGVVLTDYAVNMGDAEKGHATVTMSMRYESLNMEHVSYDGQNMTRTRGKSAAHQKAK